MPLAALARRCCERAHQRWRYRQLSSAITKQFATTLKGELQAALQDGGPLHAVSVCRQHAPAIATPLSEQSGWQFGRTSLKPRNIGLDAPDARERRILQQLEDRRGRGEAVDSPTYAKVVEEHGDTRYGYMQAIPTAQVCLACHGSNIDPALAEAIDAAYPEGQANGFATGDIRGALTLSRPRGSGGRAASV